MERPRRDRARPAQGAHRDGAVLADLARTVRRALAGIHRAQCALGRERLRLGRVDADGTAYVQPRHRRRRHAGADRADVQRPAGGQTLRPHLPKLRLLEFRRAELDSDLRGGLLGAEVLMRTWFALIVAPLLALADQSVSYATVAWSCAHQHSLPLHLIHGPSLVTVVVGTFIAWSGWRGTSLLSPSRGAVA